jgi:hypothetical protein
MVTVQLALGGLNLTSPGWSLSALTAVVATVLNVSSGSVNAVVTSYAVTVTLQLAAAPPSPSSAAGAMTALFAATAGVDPSTISVTAAVPQSGGRRRMLQSGPTTMLVHIGGLPAANPGAVASLQQQLASPTMQAAASTALQVPVTSCSAAAEAVLTVTVSTPTLALAQAVSGMFSTSGSLAQITVALQAAGVPVSGVTALAPPQVGYMPPPAGNVPASAVPPAAIGLPPPLTLLPPSPSAKAVPGTSPGPVTPHGVNVTNIIAVVVSVGGALILAATLLYLRARRKAMKNAEAGMGAEHYAKSSGIAEEGGLLPHDPPPAAFITDHAMWKPLDFTIHSNATFEPPSASPDVAQGHTSGSNMLMLLPIKDELAEE